jgi:hypothetical protein
VEIHATTAAKPDISQENAQNPKRRDPEETIDLRELKDQGENDPREKEGKGPKDQRDLREVRINKGEGNIGLEETKEFCAITAKNTVTSPETARMVHFESIQRREWSAIIAKRRDILLENVQRVSARKKSNATIATKSDTSLEHVLVL